MYRHGLCVVFVGNTDCRADIQINEQTRLRERQQNIHTSMRKQKKHLFYLITYTYTCTPLICLLVGRLTDLICKINSIFDDYLFNFFLVSIFICWYCARCVIAILFWLHSFIKKFLFFLTLYLCVLKHSFITTSVSQIYLI